jgi:hypothetical protein
MMRELDEPYDTVPLHSQASREIMQQIVRLLVSLVDQCAEVALRIKSGV